MRSRRPGDDRAATLVALEDVLRRRRFSDQTKHEGNDRLALGVVQHRELRHPEPFVELSENETFLSALGKLSVAEDALGHVVGAGGKSLGFVTGRDLRQALLRAQ